MVAFARLFLFPVTAGGHGAARPTDAEPAHIAQMMEVFRPMLLQTKGMLQAQLDLADDGCIRLVWGPSGLTAGVGVWMENRRVMAASLLKSGLDGRDDSRTIATLINSRLLPCSTEGWNAVASSPTPLLVNLYRDDAAISDRRIALASTSLAAAFFGLLGISREDQNDTGPFESDDSAEDQEDEEDDLSD